MINTTSPATSGLEVAKLEQMDLIDQVHAAYEIARYGGTAYLFEAPNSQGFIVCREKPATPRNLRIDPAGIKLADPVTVAEKIWRKLRREAWANPSVDEMLSRLLA